MNNGIIETLCGKRQALVAAIALAVLTVFVTVPAVAADKAGQTEPAAAAALADKQETAPEAVKDAEGSRTLDEAAKAALEAEIATEEGAMKAAAEERKWAELTEKLKLHGWIVGPVKDKSELPPFKMIFIKGGCFEMGDWTGDGDDDERPVHTACVSNYYLSETEVTQKLFGAVMGLIPSRDKSPDKPVTNLTPGQVKFFIKALNKLTGGFYRLPTEAEWEYAARSGGKQQRWAGTDNEEELQDYAWLADNSNGAHQKVGQKKPNGLGLYDMTGNVWEWMEDFFDFDYYERSSRRDPLNMTYAKWFTMRGGSFADSPYTLRTTYRYGTEHMRSNTVSNLGIRLAQ